MKIDIPRMLLHLRRELAEGANNPSERSAPVWERLAMKAWRLSVGSAFMMRLSGRVGSLLQRPFVRKGRLRWLPPPLSGWTRHRTLPPLASKPFRARWRSISEDSRD